MKKLILPLVAIMSMIFAACSPEPSDSVVAAQKTVTQQDTTTPIQATGNAWYFIGYDLSEFKNQNVKIDFSCEMKVTNNTDSDINLKWQVNESQTSYPLVAEHTFPAGTSDWTPVASSEEQKNTSISLGESNQLYLSTYDLDTTKISIELRNVQYTVHYYKKADQVNWLDESVPSLKETYADIFDSMGLACEYISWKGEKELSVKSVRDGLAKHVDSISMGNEFKPDSFFGYQWSGSGKTMVDFAASNGKTIKVPKDLQFTTADKCLAACKEAGLKMRGHVLVWHAQTPDNFFAENYVANIQDNLITNKVSPEVMNARMEWYIKTILEHVAEWESINNDGEHIIWAWDVINETVADDADDSNWVRGSTAETKNRPPASAGDGACGSRWYQVYGDSSFVIDAFRFANAYAPADVKLCYNDYNEYMPNKTEGIIKLIQAVKAGSKKTINGKPVAPRIDVMGLQSHVGTQWPGVSSYEEALKKYLKLVDCHVTEFDVSATTANESANSYAEYFKMLKQYGKKYSGSHRITNVTIWGINNKSSWIYKDNVKYPLLFDNFETTKTFWAVINTAK